MCLRAQCLEQFYSPCTYRDNDSVIQKHGFSYYCYCNDTHLSLSFQLDVPMDAARISASWTEMSCWMLNDHQLNLAKTELRKFSVNPTFMLQLTHINFTDHIALARSCRFALYNIRKIRPFLTGHATELLVQALVLSRLDYCTALLADLPACTIKPLQLIQHVALRVVFNELKRVHVTHLITLLWLLVAAYITSQRGINSLSQTFTWTVCCCCNKLPNSAHFQEMAKNASFFFHEHLTH